MKPDLKWKQIGVVFLCALAGYLILFSWIEHRRRKEGPWQATFTSVDGLPAIIVNHSKLAISNVTIAFVSATAPAQLPQTVAFEHGRSAPFDLPFGQCVFLDTLFLPGTAACEIYGHQIQFMPRKLTIDRTERPWLSGEKILLTNPPSATLPAR